MRFGLAILCLATKSFAVTGVVHTAEVDLGYEVLGNGAQPVIVANGGPGLSHIYMMQNDVWERLSKGRKIVFYDQHGTGKSTRVTEGAPQTMDAQVVDLEAIRAHFGFAKFALVGDSYGGLLAMAYAAAHPEHIDKLDYCSVDIYTIRTFACENGLCHSRRSGRR
jgi:proline iminopeptidase